MATELVINATSHETRIALIENGTIAELHIERTREKGIIGNIYKGRVIRVLPGMQAAFVDIGLEKAAFMHVSDLSMDAEPGDMLVEAEEDDKDSDVLRPKRQSAKPIEQLLTEGQELMVQISKGPIRSEEHTSELQSH